MAWISVVWSPCGALDRGEGILIVTNHPANPDPYVFLHVADRLKCPFYYMAAWQVFQRESWLGRRILRRHGCFSINREDEDSRAMRFTVDILRNRPHPLVTLAEGELYHTSEHVHPFRAGTGALALAAARHAAADCLHSRRPQVLFFG
jgi:1-acyl-sn-glycerol-3-phosphate acyltransferase